jgi:hypothetical protein
MKGNAISGRNESRVTYPKKDKNPSSAIGNQKSWPMPDNSNVCKYPGKGPSGNKLDTERAKTLVCHGQSTAAPGNDYPGEWSYSKGFDTVKKLSSGG